MYSCLEHIEEAIDRFLDDFGKLPLLSEVENDSFCDLCKQTACYKIMAGTMVEDHE